MPDSPIKVPHGLEWVAAIGAALMGALAGAVTYWFLAVHVIAPME